MAWCMSCWWSWAQYHPLAITSCLEPWLMGPDGTVWLVNLWKLCWKVDIGFTYNLIGLFVQLATVSMDTPCLGWAGSLQLRISSKGCLEDITPRSKPELRNSAWGDHQLSTGRVLATTIEREERYPHLVSDLTWPEPLSCQGSCLLSWHDLLQCAQGLSVVWSLVLELGGSFCCWSGA